MDACLNRLSHSKPTLYMCACVRVRERERECVCVCVCVTLHLTYRFFSKTRNKLDAFLEILSHNKPTINVWVCVCACMWERELVRVCVCMCVRERECVCVCVCKITHEIETTDVENCCCCSSSHALQSAEVRASSLDLSHATTAIQLKLSWRRKWPTKIMSKSC